MMFSDTPTVHQRTPHAIRRFDQNTGDGLGAAVENAHLEIGQHQIVYLVLVICRNPCAVRGPAR